MSLPLVSVIVPAYKVTEFIGETLDSLRAQTFRDFETIVVNDGCPDSENLEKVLAPYQNEIVYIRQENLGLAGARNTALRAARAPLVALLDSDDIWEPEYLAVQTAAIAARPDVDVVYPNARYFGPSTYEGRTLMDVFPSQGEVTFESLVDLECRVFVGVIARKAAFEKVGNFDATLRSAEDLDLWLRLALNGSRFAFHAQPLVRYRARPNNLSNDPLWMGKSVLHVYEKLRTGATLNASQRASLERAIARERATLDFFYGKRALYAKNRSEALERLGRANQVLNNRKLSVALLALRVAPGLVYRYIHSRHPDEYSFMH